jgi:hypothetical protein
MKSFTFLGSKVAYWLVAPWTILGAIAFAFVSDGSFASGEKSGGFLAGYFSLLCLIGLYAMSAQRHGLLCGRFVAATIGALYIGYFVITALIEQQSLLPTGKMSDVSPFNAILGFFFIGLPCLQFAVSGKPFWSYVRKGRDSSLSSPTPSPPPSRPCP